ncbi:hypothetical protein Tco_0417641 [Tanacetum coccineum]
MPKRQVVLTRAFLALLTSTGSKERKKLINQSSSAAYLHPGYGAASLGMASFTRVTTPREANKCVLGSCQLPHPDGRWDAINRGTLPQEGSKDLTSLSFDKLIGNLNVHEVIIKKDSKIVKSKREQSRYIALKAKKESSDEENSNFESEDEGTHRREELFIKVLPKTRCEDPNHLIGECPKPPRNKNKRVFVGGSWSDRGEEEEEKTKDETCLMRGSKQLMSSPPPKTSPLEDDLVKEEAIKVSEKKTLGNDVENETLEIDEIVNIKESKSHPLETS